MGAKTTCLKFVGQENIDIVLKVSPTDYLLTRGKRYHEIGEIWQTLPFSTGQI